MTDGQCRLPAAVERTGSMPSRGVCSTCDDYDGPPRGAGDVVHTIARATGIARVVEKVAGKDCGCARRRAALNAAISLADPEPENR